MSQPTAQFNSHEVGGSDRVDKPVVRLSVSDSAGQSNDTHDNAQSSTDSSSEDTHDQDPKSAWSPSSDSSSTTETSDSEQEEEDERARERRELDAQFARGKVVDLTEMSYTACEEWMGYSWMKGFMGIRVRDERKNGASFSNMRKSRLSSGSTSPKQSPRGDKTPSALATHIVSDDEFTFAPEEETVERQRTPSISPVSSPSIPSSPSSPISPISPISHVFHSETEAPTRPGSPVGHAPEEEDYNTSPEDLYSPTHYQMSPDSTTSGVSATEEAERQQQQQLALAMVPDRGSTLRQPEHYRNNAELARLRVKLCEEWIRTYAARPPMSAPFMFLNQDQVIELFYCAAQLKRERDTYSNQMRSVVNRAAMLKQNQDRSAKMLETVTTKYTQEKKRVAKAEKDNEVLARELEEEYDAHDGEVHGLKRELEKKEADWQKKLEALKNECEKASLMEKDETISQVNWKIRKLEGVPEFIHRHLQSAAIEDDVAIPTVGQIKEQLEKTRSFPDLCLFLWSLDVHVHFEQLAKTLHVREHLGDISKVFAPVIVRLITFLEQKLNSKPKPSSEKGAATRPHTPTKAIKTEPELAGLTTLNAENESLKTANAVLTAELARLHQHPHSSPIPIKKEETVRNPLSLQIPTLPVSPSSSTTLTYPPTPTFFTPTTPTTIARKIDAYLSTYHPDPTRPRTSHTNRPPYTRAQLLAWAHTQQRRAADIAANHAARLATLEARRLEREEEDAAMLAWWHGCQRRTQELMNRIRAVREGRVGSGGGVEGCVARTSSAGSAMAYGEFGFGGREREREREGSGGYAAGCSPITGMPRLPVGARYGR
ncbi:hypothetical protein K490DRAFT_67988 [Saccharata proteae CBS 121410]|uniref:Uncharacterized protein n=1 Tax=Saccharata proteae CBS 121410 TaxID=1314787 RepID=A0A9P4HQJ6_9PEZI|nr:hypothetical protein K490DRAFT_67988 [Saccharata proteae CBS 121410]